MRREWWLWKDKEREETLPEQFFVVFGDFRKHNQTTACWRSLARLLIGPPFDPASAYGCPFWCPCACFVSDTD